MFTSTVWWIVSSTVVCDIRRSSQPALELVFSEGQNVVPTVHIKTGVGNPPTILYT